MTALPRIETRRLTPELLADWLAFFDGPAFADNPDWGGCYCRAFRFEASLDAWDDACASGANRTAMADQIARGEVSGVLAFEGDRPVGWCQFGPRTAFRHPAIRATPGDDAADVGSIVCFVVAATHRRRGVARALLDAACAALADDGFLVAEAYPDRDEAEHRFMCGPAAMYAAAGFTRFRDAGTRTVVRRPLQRRGPCLASTLPPFHASAADEPGGRTADGGGGGGGGGATSEEARKSGSEARPQPRGRVRGVVLAAGASSRMGWPKALLPIGGRPAVEVVAETLLAGGASAVTVVVGCHAAEIRAGARLPGADVVEHAGWAAGRTSSLQAGLRTLPEDTAAALVALVDMPFVRADTVAALVAAFQADPSAEAVVPVHDGRRGHPLLVARTLFPRVLALGPDDSPRAVLAASRRSEVPVDDPGVLLDLDTPDDLARAAPC